MTLFRSALAILAGLVTVVVLSEGADLAAVGLKLLSFDGPDPTLPLAIATAYRSLFAVLGGYLAAKLAPAKATMHAVILGFVGAALALSGMLAHLSTPHLWYPVALVVTALPSCWLGGKLAAA